LCGTAEKPKLPEDPREIKSTESAQKMLCKAAKFLSSLLADAEVVSNDCCFLPGSDGTVLIYDERFLSSVFTLCCVWSFYGQCRPIEYNKRPRRGGRIPQLVHGTLLGTIVQLYPKLYQLYQFKPKGGEHN